MMIINIIRVLWMITIIQKTSSFLMASSSRPSISALQAFDVSGMWTSGLSFGKGEFKFYKSFQSWMSVFPEDDRKSFPEIFNLPKGTYEVIMNKPLGIVFEEIEPGKGVFVQDLVEGGNAERQGVILKGDILVGVTAVKVIGAKWERRLLPARPFDFDTVIGAISSNEPKWGCDNVVLLFERPGEANSDEVDEFMKFFNPPGDSPWRQQQ